MQARLECCRQFIPVGNALRVGDEARIGRQVGGSHNLAQPRELPVVSYGERENAVAGVESFVGRDRRMPITERARRVARREEPRGLVHQRREQAREKSDLDVLPEPAPGTLVQGSEDGDRGILSRQHIDDRNADLGWGSGRPGDVHETAHRLHEKVVASRVGAGLATEPRDRRIDDGGIARTRTLVVEPEPLEGAGQEILDDDVCA